jgi:hypothetical protein
MFGLSFTIIQMRLLLADGVPLTLSNGWSTGGHYRSGIITVASGTKVIYFKCFRAGSSTLDIGAGVGPSGFIQAVQLYA